MWPEKHFGNIFESGFFNSWDFSSSIEMKENFLLSAGGEEKGFSFRQSKPPEVFKMNLSLFEYQVSIIILCHLFRYVYTLKI